MKQYTATAKLWITLDAESPEEAQELSKSVVDEALYEYITANKEVLERQSMMLGISKAKVIWVKENK